MKIEFLELEHRAYYNTRASHIHNWSGNDSEENYLSSVKKNPNWMYKDVPISYKLNEYSFRTDSFNDIDWEKSIIVLGCSVVHGVGLPVEWTLCHQLSELSGDNVVNLGVPGACNLRIWSLLTTLINAKVKPKAFVIVWSDPNRFTEFKENGMVGYSAGTPNIEDKSELAYHHVAHPTQGVETTIRLIQSSKAMCGNIPNFSYAWYLHPVVSNYSKCFIYPEADKIDAARDNMHAGLKLNRVWAEQIYKDISN